MPSLVLDMASLAQDQATLGLNRLRPPLAGVRLGGIDGQVEENSPHMNA